MEVQPYLFVFKSALGDIFGVGVGVRFKSFFGTYLHRLTTFILEVLLCLAFLKLSWLGGWLENLILIKTQSSAQTWTWILDFNLGFVKKLETENKFEELNLPLELIDILYIFHRFTFSGSQAHYSSEH